jgi:hypothetical protein
MNCQSCDTSIDYRFLTNCPQCETAQTDLVPIDRVDAPVEVEIRPKWTRRLASVVYFFMASFAGMISGAVVIFFSTIMAYNAFMSNDPARHSCGQGELIAILALITGGFLGTVGGSVFAMKNPICKN